MTYTGTCGIDYTIIRTKKKKMFGSKINQLNCQHSEAKVTHFLMVHELFKADNASLVAAEITVSEAFGK